MLRVCWGRLTTRHAITRWNRVCDRVHRRKYLRTFTVTYEKCSSSGGCIDTNITYRGIAELEFLLFSRSYPVRERSPPSNFAKDNLPPTRYKPPVTPLPLYTIISMGHAKGRVKGWREKFVGVLEGGDRFNQFKNAMLQDTRETKEYFRQHPNANIHRQRNKGICKIQKMSSKFSPKSWTHFKKAWAIGKNTSANHLRQ